MEWREVCERSYWVFDMDGTLTCAAHDFDAIRDELGLPRGVGILEALEALPVEESGPLYAKLHALEYEIALGGRAQEGVGDVLEGLRGRGCRLGVLTRNALDLAHVTLKASGLWEFFEEGSVLGRGCAQPKPSPEGVLRLLGMWSRDEGCEVLGGDGVMVGDFRFDLEAGRRAGCATVWFDGEGEGEETWSGLWDVRVCSWEDVVW